MTAFPTDSLDTLSRRMLLQTRTRLPPTINRPAYYVILAGIPSRYLHTVLCDGSRQHPPHTLLERRRFSR